MPPFYLGMDRNRFNREVRPYLMEIPVGEQGIAFDRLDLDAWADEHKRRSGRPATWKGGTTCLENQRLGSASAAVSGTSTNGSKSYRAGDFERAKVNTGTREQEVCRLRWEWEVAVPELETSVFLIPPRDQHGRLVKNGEERLLVLNHVARSVIVELRAEGEEECANKSRSLC